MFSYPLDAKEASHVNRKDARDLQKIYRLFRSSLKSPQHAQREWEDVLLHFLSRSYFELDITHFFTTTACLDFEQRMGECLHGRNMPIPPAQMTFFLMLVKITEPISVNQLLKIK